MDIERECIYCGAKFKAPKRGNEKPGLGGTYGGICPTDCQSVPISPSGNIKRKLTTVNLIYACGILNNFCSQFNACFKCPLNIVSCPCPIRGIPSTWNLDFIIAKLTKPKEDTNDK